MGIVAAAAASGCGTTVQLGFDECSYDGHTYAAMESFDAGDGCNTCTCQSDGTVACTELACAPACEYQGQLYMSGASFPAGDGCNNCSCQDDGSVVCTEIACMCETPVDCAAPPEGCHYEGGDCNSCGNLVCDCAGDPMIACPTMAPEGCHFAPPECVMGQWQCGQLECSCGGCDTVACIPEYQCEPDQNGCGVCVPLGQISCVYDGAAYQPGESFPAGDGCNTCYCDMTGMIACTGVDCTCAPCDTMLCGMQTCTEDMNGCGHCGTDTCTSCMDLNCGGMGLGCVEDMNGCGTCAQTP